MWDLCVFGGGIVFYFNRAFSAKRCEEREEADGGSFGEKDGKAEFVTTQGLYFLQVSVSPHTYNS
jgi:hypothetical protein